MPPQSASHTLLQYYCTTNAQYTPPTRAPLCMPYTIQYWQWQYRKCYPGYLSSKRDRTQEGKQRRRWGAPHCALAFTRYCFYQYCMVYSIHTGVWKGSRILSNNRAIVLHQGGQCMWAGGVKGWWIRAQQPRSKKISRKGQLVPWRGSPLTREK